MAKKKATKRAPARAKAKARPAAKKVSPIPPGYTSHEPLVGLLLAVPWSWLAPFGLVAPVSYTHLTLPTIYSV